MNLQFNTELANQYHSATQVARVLTEDWLGRNMYCPRCGHYQIVQFENNRPVADFYCEFCGAEYELKGKTGKLSNKIADGAYRTMIERITSNENPDLFCMQYAKDTYSVQNLLVIPKHFFTPDIIEQRPPLASTARRAGWVGCNIMIHQVPQQGRIPIIVDGQEVDSQIVLDKMARSCELEEHNVSMRGWLMDVLHCVNHMSSDLFTLAQMYGYEDWLTQKHPENHHIQAKIRQQLQMLRDRGFIEFLGNGRYRKVGI